MGGRLTVGHGTLDPSMKVRFLPPQQKTALYFFAGGAGAKRLCQGLERRSVTRISRCGSEAVPRANASDGKRLTRRREM